MKRSKPQSIAIVGIACRFPKADNLESYWKNLKNGVDGITDIPASHWDPADYFDKDPKKPDMTYARRGGFLSPMDFNPMAFGMAPNNIEATDTAQLFGMAVAQDALKDAGYADKEFDRDRTSVILGVTGTLELVVPLGARLGHPIWRKAMKEAGVDDAAIEDAVSRISAAYPEWQENSFPGLLGNVVAGRIANHLDLGGTNCVVDAACASSLSAVSLASLELQYGRADMVITGGVDTFNDIFMYMCFSKTPALSPTGDAKSFDASADGTILGEGVGMIVLKRLADAERDGDKIYAVIKGMGSSSDGKGTAIYEPNAGGQARALKNAYRESEISPETVELVEAHGTGTKVGDATEVSALTEVYREVRKEGTWCALGSVKSMIGHTKAAAGVAGLIKAVMSLKNKTLPPTIKVKTPNEKVAPKTTPFYLNTSKRPWLPREEHPRRAAISALGFGGSNFHCVVEEYTTTKPAPDWDGDVQLVALSAKETSGIDEALGAFPTNLSWEGIRAAAARTRAAFDPKANCRLLAVLEKDGDSSVLLAQARTLLKKNANAPFWSAPNGLYFGRGAAPGTLGILFPGQGSQYTGMLSDLACQFPRMLSTLVLSNKVVSRLSDKIYPHPTFTEEDAAIDEMGLRATEIAQPAIGAVSLGAYRVLEDFGVKAEAAAGHSYGELTALCAAGRFSEETFFKLSELRGRLMGSGKGDLGSMLAVMAPLADVEKALEEGKFDLVLANKNAPSQSVLSGSTEEIARAEKEMTAMGLRVKRLQVAAAFHSKFVSDARKPFEKALDDVDFQKQAFPVFANTTAEIYPANAAKSRVILGGQLANPVEFVREVENLYASGVRTFLEVGPGARLTGLVKAILDGKDFDAAALDASGGKRSGISDLARALANVASRGHAVDLSKWDEGFVIPEEKDSSKPAFTMPLSGANYMAPRKAKPVRAPTTSGGGTPSPMGSVVSAPAALARTEEHLEALQRIQEQTATLHAKFLAGQETALATIQTLIAREQGRSVSAAPPAPAAPSENGAEQVDKVDKVPGTMDTSKVEQILLEVVGEKTGYPAEMLNLDMGLDSDLGIDSIKRVEILSALQEKLPEAPAVKPDQLGALRTLRQIVEYLGSSVPTPSENGANQVDKVDKVPGTMDTSKVEQVLLEVVGEKTGYPAEMLNLDMGLDSDLGIDSIKRVEILSALQEKLPEAPAVKPDQLGALRTLRQIVEYLSAGALKHFSPSGSESEKSVEDQGRMAPKADQPLSRQVLRLGSLGNDREPLGLAKGSEIWITDDGEGLSARVAKGLKTRGFKPRILDRKDWAGTPAPKQLGGLLILAPTKGSGVDFVKDSLFLAKKAAPGLRALAGSFFAAATRFDGAFGLKEMAPEAEFALGGLWGLAKTAGREWPEVACKALDIDAAHKDLKAAADSIVEELLLRGPSEVGIFEAGKSAVELVSEDLTPGKHIPLSPDDVVLVTGGARGVTAEAAVALAAAYKPTLVLLGRSPAPTPEPDWLSSLETEAEIKKALLARAGRTISPKELGEQYRDLAGNREMLSNISRMERAGATVLYRSVDVRDASAVRSLLEDLAENEGKVRGLIHGAGVLSDKLIVEKTEDQFDRVYGTKVEGLRRIWDVLDTEALKVLVLFSSTTARLGRTGQSDYAIANEVLNAFARRTARILPGCRVLSVNWGPWEGGMVSAALRKVFEKEGVGLIPLEKGAAYLVEELGAGDGPVETVILGEGSAAGTGTAERSKLSPVFERRLSLEENPVLKSHVIGGAAVLPMALIVEWFAHGAMHGNPGLVFTGFEDLRVLKGVRVQAGDSPVVGVFAGVAVRKDGKYNVSMELRGAGGVVHAKGAIVLADRALAKEKPVVDVRPTKFPGPTKRMYSDYLFHGPDLQGIRSIEGCAPEGIVADVATAPSPSQWLENPLRSRWITDPMALDCAFQLMIVWSFEKHRAGCLPTYVARYRQFRSSFPEDGVRIVIRVTKNGKHRALADIEFVDGKGELVARLSGYECVVDASLNDAFKSKTLAAAV